MQVLNFKIEVSFYQRKELKKVKKEILCSSSTKAWQFGLAMVPEGINQVQIRVTPPKRRTYA